MLKLLSPYTLLMLFASIQEVYGNEFGKDDSSLKNKNNYQNIHKNIVNYNKQYSDKELEEFIPNISNTIDAYNNGVTDNFYNDDEIIDLPETNKNKKEENNKCTNCNDFIKHIINCPKCKMFLEKYYSKKSNIVPEKREDKFLDIAIYVMSGIFILVLLDIFVRLGKFVKK